jgi:hypothetical protein
LDLGESVRCGRVGGDELLGLLQDVFADYPGLAALEVVLGLLPGVPLLVVSTLREVFPLELLLLAELLLAAIGLLRLVLLLVLAASALILALVLEGGRLLVLDLLLLVVLLVLLARILLTPLFVSLVATLPLLYDLLH